MSNGEQSEVSESQIASHWREEELISPGADFIAQANMADTSVFDRFTMENYPEYFREYADPAHVGQVLAHHPGHLQPALLEVVSRGAS